MAYSESKKLTDTEKRLQALKTQLFGKTEGKTNFQTETQADKEHTSFKTYIASGVPPSEDMVYLKKDLYKIFILAIIAISTQLILYLQFTFKFLKFN